MEVLVRLRWRDMEGMRPVPEYNFKVYEDFIISRYSLTKVISMASAIEGLASLKIEDRT